MRHDHWPAGSLEYAQARLSARYGDRPDELEWRRLEHVRAFPALLDVAHASVFALGRGIGVQSLPHEIERVCAGTGASLSPRWLRGCRKTGRPQSAGARRSPILPVLQHLARGGAPLPWMRDDPVYREPRRREPAILGLAPERRMPAPLAAAWSDADRIGSLWVAEWRRRIPRTAACRRRDSSQRSGRALAAHLDAFRDRALRDGWPLRRTLQARLALLVSPRDARSRRRLHLSRAGGARPRAPARRNPAPRHPSPASPLAP